MKTFEIQYINRYYEEKTYSVEIIKAISETVALKKFAKLFKIKDYQQLFDPTFRWEDGMWMTSFKCINEVNEIVCPHCHGKGKISIVKKYGFK